MTDDLRSALLSLADEPLQPPDPVGDLHSRWRRRRHRRTAARAALAVAATIAMVAGAVTLIDHGGDRSETVGVTATAPSTTSAPTTLPPAVNVIGGKGATPALDPPTTVLTCHNEYASVCGPFRWDPGPVSSPLTVTVTAEPANPKPGQQVTFSLDVTGLNAFAFAPAPESGDGGVPRLVDGGIACAGTGSSSAGPRSKYGPWDLPAENMRLKEIHPKFTYTYVAAGTYTARFRFETGNCDRQYENPYPGDGVGTVTVTVSP